MANWRFNPETVHLFGPKCMMQQKLISGLQKGPAERGHVKKSQKSSKSVKKFFDTFRQFSRRAKNVKNRQKASKMFSTLFDNFRAAPFFRPLLQSAELSVKCSATRVSRAAPPPGALRGFGGPHYTRHPTRGSGMGCDRALSGGCSCDTPVAHSKLRKEP